MSEQTVAWPVVLPNDDGIRPAGEPNECFYCRQHVGEPHTRDCVTIHKRVRLRYVFEVDVEVPHKWDKDTIELHRNGSIGRWCADNAIDDLDHETARGDASCWCSRFRAEFVEVLDDTPTQRVKAPGRR